MFVITKKKKKKGKNYRSDKRKIANIETNVGKNVSVCV